MGLANSIPIVAAKFLRKGADLAKGVLVQRVLHRDCESRQQRGETKVNMGSASHNNRRQHRQ
jgi:hypothetical protein